MENTEGVPAATRKPREKIKIPGRTEEEIKEIKYERKNQLEKEKRARNRQYKEKNKVKKRIFLTACFDNEYEGTLENSMKVVLDIADVCAKHNVKIFETCQARYATLWAERKELCDMWGHGNAKKTLEELCGKELPHIKPGDESPLHKPK